MLAAFQKAIQPLTISIYSIFKLFFKHLHQVSVLLKTRFMGEKYKTESETIIPFQKYHQYYILCLHHPAHQTIPLPSFYLDPSILSELYLNKEQNRPNVGFFLHFKYIIHQLILIARQLCGIFKILSTMLLIRRYSDIQSKNFVFFPLRKSQKLLS